MPEGLVPILLLTGAGGALLLGYAVAHAAAMRRLSTGEMTLGRMAGTSALFALLLVATSAPALLPMLSPVARRSIQAWPGFLLYLASFAAWSFLAIRHLRRTMPRTAEGPAPSVAMRLIAAAFLLVTVIGALSLWTMFIAWLAGIPVTIGHVVIAPRPVP